MSTDPRHRSPDPYLRAVAALVQLSGTLVEARGVRYLAAHRPRAEALGVSSGVEHGDETSDVALDPRRLALSAVVATTERLLASFAAAALRADAALLRAIETWNGEDANV